MGRPAARMGDMTAHGGVIVAGFPQVLIGGQPAARLVDSIRDVWWSKQENKYLLEYYNSGLRFDVTCRLYEVDEDDSPG